MRADHAQRHNAAVGALVGLAVGEIIARCDEVPDTVCGGALDLEPWGPISDRSFDQAEQILRGQPVDMDVSATSIVASALFLDGPDATPPLLADSGAVLMCSLISNGLAGRFEPASPSRDQSDLTLAITTVDEAASFADAVTAVSPNGSSEAISLTGALAGLRWGHASIPSAWATAAHGPVGSRTYSVRQLRRLTERLLGQEAPTPPEPFRSLGPREVAPGLWLSNLHAVTRFVDHHPTAAVISLCPTTGAFDTHPFRREFAVHDAGGRTVNPRLAEVVDEILATITAFHDEGRDVLVHCHHGASRTGLILRAWLMQELGLCFEDATTEAQVRWPKTSTWNHAFAKELQRRDTV